MSIVLFFDEFFHELRSQDGALSLCLFTSYPAIAGWEKPDENPSPQALEEVVVGWVDESETKPKDKGGK
jgi:hypothetical protein